MPTQAPPPPDEILARDCPGQRELVAFVAGELPEGSLISISDHVAVCDTCRRSLESIHAAPDALERRLKTALAWRDDFDEEVCQRLVGSASRLWLVMDRQARGKAIKEATEDQTTETWSLVPTTAGRYQVLSFLGEGKYSRVFLVYDPELDRQAALKVFKSADGVMSQPDVLQEARSAARLSHDGIVTVYEVSCDQDGRPFIAMEPVAGTLKDLVHAGPQPPLRVASLIRQAADAVHYAHKSGMVHRDLKPANILLKSNDRIKIADFGLALAEEQQRACAGEHAGTPAYMSPEQVRGEAHRLDGRSDIWSLGVVMYELLAGRRPFTGSYDEVADEILHRSPKPLRQIRDDVDSNLEQICMKCLAKEPSERYASAKELAEAIESWVRSTTQKPEKPRRGIALWSLATAAALLVTATAAWTWLPREIPYQVDAVARPLVPLDLLTRKPKELSPPHFTESWHHDPDQRRMSATSGSVTLFGVGETQCREFKLQATFTKIAQAGYCGIFVGFHELPAPSGQRLWKFQYVRVSQEIIAEDQKRGPADKPRETVEEGKKREPDGEAQKDVEKDKNGEAEQVHEKGKNRAPRFLVERISVVIHQPSPTATRNIHSRDLGIQKLDPDVVSGSILEITVHNNTIREVTWQGRPLPNLRDPKLDESGQVPTCSGQFGMTNERGSMMVSDVKFISLGSKKP